MTDMIDLSTVRILNSPDIHDWPATAAITALELRPSGVHVDFTKKTGADRWPDVPFGNPSEHGTLQYTLWILLDIAGQWLAAGCIEFWFGLDENGGPVDGYAKNWYYDANRWPGMAGHQPAVGELVGFLVTSGDARHGDDGVGLHERSNIVTVAFPDAAGHNYSFPSAPPVDPPAQQPPAQQPPTQQPPTQQPPTSGPSDDLLATIGEFVIYVHDVARSIDALATSVAAIEARLTTIERDGVRIRL